MRTEEQKNNIRALIGILEKNPMKYKCAYMADGPNECCVLGYGLLRCSDVEITEDFCLRSKICGYQLDRVIKNEYGLNAEDQTDIAYVNDTTEGWEEVIKLLKTYL